MDRTRRLPTRRGLTPSCLGFGLLRMPSGDPTGRSATGRLCPLRGLGPGSEPISPTEPSEELRFLDVEFIAIYWLSKSRTLAALVHSALYWPGSSEVSWRDGWPD
jgi:hypothetical protein